MKQKLLLCLLGLVSACTAMPPVIDNTYTLQQFAVVTPQEASQESTETLCDAHYTAYQASQAEGLIITGEQEAQYQAAAARVQSAGYETADQLLKTVDAVIQTRLTHKEWIDAQSSPQIGDSAEVATCRFGAPDHENTDALGPDQLVYNNGGDTVYVYVQNGLIVDIQTSD